MTISVAMHEPPGRLRAGPTLEQVYAWDNLLLACHQAARGKRGTPAAAAFEHQVGDRLLALQARLAAGTWQPGGYVHFYIDEPKRRCISAAPFADRVVHHALCDVIEPVFERLFIPDSYANRPGKGTHRAVDRLQALCRRYRYLLLLDIVKHFPSIDHAILLATLARRLHDPRVMDLAARIIASGDGVLEQDYRMVWFPGDDLLAACRPRGLPIGNLTCTGAELLPPWAPQMPPGPGVVGVRPTRLPLGWSKVSSTSTAAAALPLVSAAKAMMTPSHQRVRSRWTTWTPQQAMRRRDGKGASVPAAASIAAVQSGRSRL